MDWTNPGEAAVAPLGGVESVTLFGLFGLALARDAEAILSQLHVEVRILGAGDVGAKHDSCLGFRDLESGERVLRADFHCHVELRCSTFEFSFGLVDEECPSLSKLRSNTDQSLFSPTLCHRWRGCL